MNKRLFSIILALAMLLCMLPAAVMAEIGNDARASDAEGVRSELDSALNAEDTDIFLSFTSEGSYPWIVLTDDTAGDYGRSGNRNVHSSRSTVSASFVCSSEVTLSFDYKAWGEGLAEIWDACVFILDGEEVFRKGQERNDWTTYAVEEPLQAGAHTLEWYYEKDGFMNLEGDYFALNDVRLIKTEQDDPERISSIEIIDFDLPEWGANPDFEVGVPEGANYSVIAVEWYCFTPDSDEAISLDEESIFNDAAAEYIAVFSAAADEGCVFGDVTAVSVNGDWELVFDFSVSEDEAEAYVAAGIFAVEGPQVLWGDAEGDGDVDLQDPLLLMRWLIDADTVEEENLELCDVNGDGEVTLMDALLIMRKVIGTLEAFPVEC